MPKRKLSPEDEARISFIRRRLILTIGFIETVEDFPSGPQMRAIIENAAQRGDLRSLRLLERDIDAMTVALPSQQRERLEALLKEQLGIDKESERLELKHKVAEILMRRSVASERERRRLEDYLEILEATHGDAAEIAAVRQLLAS